MAKTQNEITKGEVIATYVFLFMMVTIMIACSWAVFSSWQWIIP